MNARVRWTVLVPIRALPNAKSRLAADLPPDVHADIVAAIRADTVAAARATSAVARVIVVGDQPGPDVTFVQHSPGLNGALRDGAAWVRRNWPADGIAALVADLPALTPDDLSAALDAAAGRPVSFVPDAAGTGTTLLAAAPGHDLDPRFGPDSAARHAESGVALAAGAGLREDVDTRAELDAAVLLGVGPRTAAVLAQHRLAPRSP